ncbi:hypothetical protein JTB14_018331 [Gonioctena quinquepunctata]|nr:hypothetical protein JTB14_018331 [Gonioctena quinquepunctata]
MQTWMNPCFVFTSWVRHTEIKYLLTALVLKIYSSDSEQMITLGRMVTISQYQFVLFTSYLNLLDLLLKIKIPLHVRSYIKGNKLYIDNKSYKASDLEARDEEATHSAPPTPTIKKFIEEDENTSSNFKKPIYQRK